MRVYCRAWLMVAAAVAIIAPLTTAKNLRKASRESQVAVSSTSLATEERNLREATSRDLQIAVLTIVDSPVGLLQACEGRCNTDIDCDTGLECFTGFSFSVPGCIGAKTVGDNYCFVNPAGTISFDRCEGPCLDDSVSAYLGHLSNIWDHCLLLTLAFFARSFYSSRNVSVRSCAS